MCARACSHKWGNQEPATGYVASGVSESSSWRDCQPIYVPLTDLHPDQPERGRGCGQWCCLCLSECWVLLSVLICVAVTMPMCSSVLYMCVCLQGRQPHAARGVDVTTWSCSSLTSTGHVWKYKIQDYVQNCMHCYTRYKHLKGKKKKATSSHKVWRETQKRNYYMVSRPKINTGEE